ncbi:hypothetical protein AURDEDRAFT_136885 [Auricularia subglabra TFB-10046 SS5]|nr:hypothetical protein AURDEDRAFT_136885 [Auricularia subglabra TFB-10046 SS5]
MSVVAAERSHTRTQRSGATLTTARCGLSCCRRSAATCSARRSCTLTSIRTFIVKYSNCLGDLRSIWKHSACTSTATVVTLHFSIYPATSSSENAPGCTPWSFKTVRYRISRILPSPA